LRRANGQFIRLLAFVLSVMPAFPISAETIAETTSKWGLIGPWSLDCSLPPDHAKGMVLAYETLPDGGVVHRRDFGDTADENPVIAARISHDGMLNLSVSFPAFKQRRDYGLMMQPDGTMRTIYNRNENKQYTIRDGKFTIGGKPTPVFHKCKPPGP
jgi:hypothetical protein